MKKFIVKIGVIIMALGLFGCSARLSQATKGDGQKLGIYKSIYKAKLSVLDLSKITKVR